MNKEDFFDEARRISEFVANMSPITEYADYCAFCKNHVDEQHDDSCIFVAAQKLFDIYEEIDEN